MKLLTRSFSLLTIASLVLFFANCGGGGGEESSKQKTQLSKLSKTWRLGTAKLGDNDSPDQILSNFTITFSGSYDSDSPDGPYQFDVTGTTFPSPLPETGDWTFSFFGSGDTGMILLGPDDIAINYTINSAGKLILTFNYDGEGYEAAKVLAVEGDWEFVLDPAP